MNPERKLRGSAHTGARSVLRIVGPVLVVAGVALIATGIITVVFGDPFDDKLLAAAPFLGMPLLFVGLVMSGMGYMGAVVRYQAGEIAPVGKDTFNYMAKGTQSGVRDIVGAVREGIMGETQNAITCPKCEHDNDHDARFCDNCGHALPQIQPCPGCGEVNDADARFCNQCGKVIADG